MNTKKRQLWIIVSKKVNHIKTAGLSYIKDVICCRKYNVKSSICNCCCYLSTDIEARIIFDSPLITANDTLLIDDCQISCLYNISDISKIVIVIKASICLKSAH